MRFSFGEVMPIPLAPIDCEMGNALVSVTINAKKVRNLREMVTRSG